jgi:N-acetylglucosaminyldiphosphoundecaprenol N-acetyl-beta-D-mannosaminyltransferase
MIKTRVNIAGVPFDPLSMAQVLLLIKEKISKNQKIFLVTPNPEFVVEAQHNSEFLAVLKKADLAIPDGIGILWAARFLNDYPAFQKTRFNYFKLFFLAYYSLCKGVFNPRYFQKIIPERVTGTDLFHQVCAEAARQGWKIFLLGAAPGVAERVKQILEQKHPKITLAGVAAGSPKVEDEAKVIQMINQTAPDILFVAYGAPKQELWINRNFCQLKTVKFVAGVGGAFDFVAGKQKRASCFFRGRGLEWGVRIIREPKRWKRIYRATIQFINLIILKKMI